MRNTLLILLILVGLGLILAIVDGATAVRAHTQQIEQLSRQLEAAERRGLDVLRRFGME